MRWISVSPADLVEEPGGVRAGGFDDQTGEHVEFMMSFAWADAVKATPGAPSLMQVADDDIISVTRTAPVSGEWDSPGTSEEG